MATVPEGQGFVEGVYQLEITDPVEAGVNGVSNQQAKELASRTRYLKDKQDLIWLTGDVKEVDCDNTYLAANFDASGLGINEREGWAICNGLNGTKNRSGRVGIAYGFTNTTLGVTGGSKDAVLVEHSHTIAVNTNAAGSGNPAFESATSPGNFSTSTEGESGTDKNMQPYIVSLFIQKL